MKVCDYKCNKCHATVQRESEKNWIDSYCSTVGDKSRLYRVSMPRDQRHFSDKEIDCFLDNLRKEEERNVTRAEKGMRKLDKGVHEIRRARIEHIQEIVRQHREYASAMKGLASVLKLTQPGQTDGHHETTR